MLLSLDDGELGATPTGSTRGGFNAQISVLRESGVRGQGSGSQGVRGQGPFIVQCSGSRDLLMELGPFIVQCSGSRDLLRELGPFRSLGEGGAVGAVQ